MHAWYERHYLVRAETEVELLIELLTSWNVLPQTSPDSFDSVKEYGCRIKVLLVKAAMYLCCEGNGVLLDTE